MLFLPPPVRRLLVAAAFLAFAVAAGLLAGQGRSARAANLGSLQSRLGAEQARQSALGRTVGGLSQSVRVLEGQISFVQAREAAVRADLAGDQAHLAQVRGQRQAALLRIARLRRTLAWARTLLARQLVSRYERGAPDLVEVVLDASGFADLLERMTFLKAAETAQQRIIDLATAAKRATTQTATRLAGLERSERALTDAAAIRVRALAGMDLLLGQREGALAAALSSAQTELSRSRATSTALRSQIARVRAAQAAAAAAAAREAVRRQAAARAAADAPSAAPTPYTVAGSGSGGFTIPSAVVLCESGGQNLTPNSAGASGYYQIMPGTWSMYGGSGPAAYLAPKSEQDAVARRIWGGGAGSTNWVCANALGIH